MAGITVAELDAWLDEELAILRRNGDDPRLRQPLDLYALANDDIEETWLVDEFWPIGRQLHVSATHKTGKSLIALWIAANLAMGRDPFTHKPREPISVGYLDFEMSLVDVKTRMFDDMGFAASDVVPNLHYYLHPVYPMFDTHDGGDDLIYNVLAHNEKAMVIDTLSRVVAGEENSNDTYIRFYKHTGVRLKALGISMMRLAHEGNTPGRTRGGTAQADDVDIVYSLQAVEDGLSFITKASRSALVPERIDIRMNDDPLSFVRAPRLWPSGTVEKVSELDKADVPLDASQRTARKLLTASGFVAGKNTILQAALNYRRNQLMWP